MHALMVVPKDIITDLPEVNTIKISNLPKSIVKKDVEDLISLKFDKSNISSIRVVADSALVNIHGYNFAWNIVNSLDGHKWKGKELSLRFANGSEFKDPYFGATDDSYYSPLNYYHSNVMYIPPQYAYDRKRSMTSSSSSSRKNSSGSQSVSVPPQQEISGKHLDPYLANQNPFSNGFVSMFPPMPTPVAPNLTAGYQNPYYWNMYFPYPVQPIAPLAGDNRFTNEYTGNKYNNILHIPENESIDDKRLFFGNLPYVTTLEDLKAALLDKHLRHFQIEIPSKDQAKGYALVTFQSKEEADQAISLFNNSKFQGRRITVRHDKFPSLAHKNKTNSETFDYYNGCDPDAKEITSTDKTVNRQTKVENDMEEAEIARSLALELNLK